MSIQLPSTDLRLRRATNADLDACAAVVKAAAEADGVSQVETRASLAHDLEHAGELGSAVLGVAEQHEEVIGFHRLGWFEQPDGLEVYTHRGHVLPDARGQGVGGALMDRAEQQLIAVAARRATPNPMVLSAWFYEGEGGVASLLGARGYERHRTMLEMQHDLKHIHKQSLPPGLEIRPFQPEQLRAVWEAYVAFSADEISSVIDTAGNLQAWQTLPQWDRKEWVVAWSGDQIVGMALSYLDDAADSCACIEFVGARRSQRRQGLARALLATTLREMQRLGATKVKLDVATDNVCGAVDLYRNSGFRSARSLVVMRTLSSGLSDGTTSRDLHKGASLLGRHLGDKPTEVPESGLGVEGPSTP